MSKSITLPKCGERITLVSLTSGNQNNDSAIAGYESHPENAEKALYTMMQNQNTIIDLISAIFMETITESTRDTIINYLTLLEAYKKLSGNDGEALSKTSTNDLFFATWVNYTCCSKKYDNVKRICSFLSLRDARVLCELQPKDQLNYEDYMVSCDSLAGETLDFMAANNDYSVQFQFRVPVVKVPTLFGADRFRIASDKSSGFMYPNNDKDSECVIPAAELMHMIQENLKDKSKIRFTSEEARRSLQEFVNTEDVHIELILDYNSYLAVGTLGSANGLKSDDIRVDDAKVEIQDKDVYLAAHNENDVTGRNDITDDDHGVGGVKLTKINDTHYKLDSAKLYIVKIASNGSMDVRSPQ